MLTTLIFTIAIFSSQVLPRQVYTKTQVDVKPYVPWLCTTGVFIVDMEISRYRFPDEMNGPELSVSEQMSYAGIASSLAMAGLSMVIPEEIHDKGLDFLAYFVVSLTAYSIWHGLDTDKPPWEA